MVTTKNCYGWLNTDHWWDTITESYYSYQTIFKIPLNVQILDFAYCTIPNYPLKFGQKSVTELGENNELLTDIHPNPSDGLVTILGNNLKAAEVYNALGQWVATATGQGEQLTLSLEGLPTGIYFINVTDTEGRKCVKKVVKK